MLEKIINTVFTGDALKTLKTFPDNIFSTCVTSPPYYGLSNYGIDGQIGLERSQEEYIAKLVDIFQEVKRCLHPSGTLWLNLGDSYFGSWCNYGGGNRGAGKQRPILKGSHAVNPVWEGLEGYRPAVTFPHDYLKPKDLMMMPSRVVIALQQDGWYLRSMIPWLKRNCMPESCDDRPNTSVEYLFLLSKSRDYFYDNEAIKVKYNKPLNRWGGETLKSDTSKTHTYKEMQKIGNSSALRIGRPIRPDSSGRNRRNSDWFFESWQGLYEEENNPLAFIVNTKGYSGAHFATFPEKLIQPCILAGTSEKGVCATCGEPWIRIVEKNNRINPSWNGSRFDDGKNLINHPNVGRREEAKTMTKYNTRRDTAGRLSLLRQQARENGGEYTNITRTIGWKQNCHCPPKIKKAIVLDPFMGSGTVALVASKLGRNYCGIELNPEYVKLSQKRTMQKTLL